MNASLLTMTVEPGDRSARFATTGSACRDDGDRTGPAVAGPPDLAPPVTQIAIAYNADCTTLTVRGSAPPLDWNRDLPTKAAPGNLCVFESPDITQPTEWKPLWKGTWSRGANYAVRPGEHVIAWPHFTTGKGRVVKLFPAFKSAALGNTRTVWAYLPPSYDENPEARFPVVYMHDGQNLFDPALAFGGNEWMVDETLDAGADVLDRAKSIREVIVIGPENTNARIDEYTPTPDADIGGGGRGGGSCSRRLRRYHGHRTEKCPTTNQRTKDE